MDDKSTEIKKEEQKETSINWNELFRSLTNTLTDCIISTKTSPDWQKQGNNFIGKLPEEIDENFSPWRLIEYSLRMSIFELIFEQHKFLENNRDHLLKYGKQLESLANNLDNDLVKLNFVLDTKVFEAPSESEIISHIKSCFEKWLNSAGFNSAESKIISSRMPAYFNFSLQKNWKSEIKLYQKVFSFLPELQKIDEQDWLYYQALQLKEIERPVFNEVFGLKQLYVPLRAYYLVPEYIEEDKNSVNKIAINLEDEISNWINEDQPADNIRFISEGAGRGKTTFLKMLTAKLAKKKHKALYIPLNKFDTVIPLETAIDRFIKENNLLSKSPLTATSPDSKLTIILDGLDTISRDGKINMLLGAEFIKKLQDFQALQVEKGIKNKIIVASSGLKSIENQIRLISSRQILHLLPYYIPGEEKESFKDEKNLLESDQRDQWWKIFGEIKGKNYQALPDELKGQNLIYLTGQPLLNYLLATSYSRNSIDFSKDINLNTIYADLLKQSHRNNQEMNLSISSVDKLKLEDFIRILEEIAVSLWYTNKRATSVNEFIEHCNTRARGLLQIFKDDSYNALKTIFQGFYFRKTTKNFNGEERFEFIHKSFCDFLNARMIACEIKIMHEQIQLKYTEWDKSWDNMEALTHWIELCGNTSINTYLLPFLINEISSKEKDEVKQWQDTLDKLIEYRFKEEMPCQNIRWNVKTYKEEKRLARNAEEALLAARFACACYTEDESNINWPDTNSIAGWFTSLQNGKIIDENLTSCKVMSYMNLADCDFSLRIISGTNLSKNNFKKANFHRAILERSEIENCNFQLANLNLADLNSANLNGSNFHMAKLENSCLKQVMAQNTNFDSAQMKKVNLKKARLQNSQLDNADIQEADLREVELQQASLQKVKLRNSDLRNAILQQANLENADLRNCDLRGTDFREANLQGANLRGSDLRGACLRGANLAEADFQQTDLNDIDLQMIDFTDAKIDRHIFKLCLFKGAKVNDAIIVENQKQLT